MMSADIAKHGSLSRICGLVAVFACLTALAGCEAQNAISSDAENANTLPVEMQVPPEVSEQVLWYGTINDGDYIVVESDQILDPEEMPGNPEVDVFPIVSGWAVARTDGTAIGKADKANARKAFASWCKGLSSEGEFVENNGDPVWLFRDCTL